MQFDFLSRPLDPGSEGRIACHVGLDFLSKRDGHTSIRLVFDDATIVASGPRNTALTIEALIRLGRELDQFWKPSGAPQPATVTISNPR